MNSLGCVEGVSGYMYYSVPAVLHAWFLNPRDYARAVTSIIRCGGDTDSTAAMLRLLVHYPISRQGAVAVIAALAVSVVMLLVVMYRRMAGRRPLRGVRRRA